MMNNSSSGGSGSGNGFSGGGGGGGGMYDRSISTFDSSSHQQRSNNSFERQMSVPSNLSDQGKMSMNNGYGGQHQQVDLVYKLPKQIFPNKCSNLKYLILLGGKNRNRLILQ